MAAKTPRKPDWLKVRFPAGPNYARIDRMHRERGLHSVCRSAACPNQGECWEQGTATFMVLGNHCTRDCRFCNVTHETPLPVDQNEPQKVAEAIKELKLRHAVITSVTRDDLEDGGASHFAAVTRAIHELSPECRVELLIPDLQGNLKALKHILNAQPQILGHNLETVPRLYQAARSGADYQRSLQLLAAAKEIAPEIPTKSGLMLGMGETAAEVIAVIKDLRAAGCEMLTLGQYLQPTRQHLPVVRYVDPDEFSQLRDAGLKAGFKHVESGPWCAPPITLQNSSKGTEMTSNVIYETIILGSGPAGLTAAIYAGRSRCCPLLIHGVQPGGQLTTTTAVDNFPGFPEGIEGPDLMDKLRQQAERFGAQFAEGEVTRVDLKERPFRIWVGDDMYRCLSLIIATGASPKLLDLGNEQSLYGRGVSVCATCDGFFYRDREVVVVGGGDTAMEEAVFLTRFAKRVTVVHRRDSLRATPVLADKALTNKVIDFAWDSIVSEILEDSNGVTGVRLKNLKTAEESELGCDGVFIAIGHKPNTTMFLGQLEMDDEGYILTRNGTETNIPGVFAAGDVQDQQFRQAVTAAGTGCMAAIQVERFLDDLPYDSSLSCQKGICMPGNEQ